MVEDRSVNGPLELEPDFASPGPSHRSLDRIKSADTDRYGRPLLKRGASINSATSPLGEIRYGYVVRNALTRPDSTRH